MFTTRTFRDREAAGRALAEHLEEYAGRSDVEIFALPRGGVPVACEVAKILGRPLDVLCVRKLGTPFHEELAMGAIAPGGIRVLNSSVIASVGVSDREIYQCERRERAELERREIRYRGGTHYPDLSGKIILLIDDGLATGATMRAAVEWAKSKAPATIVVAVPVAAEDTCAIFEAQRPLVKLCCPVIPYDFQAVGLWYQDFRQTTDEEVVALLEKYGSPGERRTPVNSEAESTRPSKV